MSAPGHAFAGALVFAAALLQVTLFASIDVAGGNADVLLLVVLALALLLGSVAGTVAGFGGGLLVDVLTLDTLGVFALLYALLGYGAGRYGETTAREPAHAKLLAVLAGTVALAVAGYALHFLLGEDVSARQALVRTLLPGLALNLLVARPVFALCRSLLGRAGGERVQEVRLLG